MAEKPVNDKKTKREAARKSIRALNDFEREANRFFMGVKRFLKEDQRMEMNESLADVAEHMRKKGASEKSIQIALKAGRLKSREGEKEESIR